MRNIAKKVKGTDGKIGIEEHTDNVGSEASNQDLSQARAEAVKKFFEDSCGIAEKNMFILAYGETMPVASNDTEVGRQLIRGAEILVFPGSV